MERTISKIGTYGEMLRAKVFLISVRRELRRAMRREKGRPMPFFWAALVLKGE